tara:strand:- start:310 stop:705 length:396 start_codon:yes stop_codon:yes gene_type:complete
MLLLILLSLSSSVFAQTIDADISGDNSVVYIHQINSNKTIDVDVNGDTANLQLQQKDSGAHNITLDISGDNIEASILQQGSGSHAATIGLENAGGAIDFELSQSGTTNKSHTSSTTCYVAAGCSVSYSQTD